MGDWISVSCFKQQNKQNQQKKTPPKAREHWLNFEAGFNEISVYLFVSEA